jgi:TBC1 domain family protein 5
MLEVNGKASWKKYEVALAGSGIADLGLYYYTNKEDETPAGCILLHSAHVDVLEEMVMVITREKTWFLCAENAREANEWSSRICATLKNASQGILGIESNSQEETRSRRRLSSNASSGTLREIQKREPKARVDEFLEIFVKSNLEDIRLQVMKGALSWSCMRNLTWKFWLGYLPQDMAFKEWIPTARSKRVRYINLRKQHTILQDSYDSSPVRQEQFLAMCDSTTENALLYAIYKDVRRTRSAMEYFCQPALQCLLVRVLYIYSKTHINISYNQGMSELLATIVYLLYVENFPTKANTNTPTNSQTSSSGPSRTSSFKSLLMNSSEGDSEDEASSYVYVESFINIKSDASYLDKDTFLRLTPFSGGSDKYQE